MDTSEIDTEERQEDKPGKSNIGFGIGCFGLVVAIGLFLRGFFPGVAALLGDQPLPIAILILGHVPFITLLVVRVGLNTPDAPEDSAKAYFWGYLTEEGLKLNSGGRIPWRGIQRYELGWASHTAIRIRLHLANKSTSPTLGSLSLTTLHIIFWLLCPLSAIAALLLAMRPPADKQALGAAICAVGVHVILGLWLVAISFLGKKQKLPEKPLELLFDAAQVSVDEVTARLDRHLPPSV